MTWWSEIQYGIGIFKKRSLRDAGGHHVELVAITGTGGLAVDEDNPLPVASGHNTTGIGCGVKTVTTAGTDVAIVAASTPAKWVEIQAQTDNTGLVAVGAAGVDATIATGTGVALYAGERLTLLVTNLADVYIDATVNSDGVRFTYGV